MTILDDKEKLSLIASAFAVVERKTHAHPPRKTSRENQEGDTMTIDTSLLEIGDVVWMTRKSNDGNTRRMLRIVYDVRIVAIDGDVFDTVWNGGNNRERFNKRIVATFAAHRPKPQRSIWATAKQYDDEVEDARISAEESRKLWREKRKKAIAKRKATP